MVRKGLQTRPDFSYVLIDGYLGGFEPMTLDPQHPAQSYYGRNKAGKVEIRAVRCGSRGIAGLAGIRLYLCPFPFSKPPCSTFTLRLRSCRLSYPLIHLVHELPDRLY